MIAKKNFFSPSIFKLSKGFLFLKKRIGWRFFALFLSANIAILMESIGITLAIPVLFSDQELKIFNYDILSYFKISGSYVLDALIIISFFFILKSFFLFFCFYYKAKVRAEFLRCLRSDIFEAIMRNASSNKTRLRLVCLRLLGEVLILPIFIICAAKDIN